MITPADTCVENDTTVVKPSFSFPKQNRLFLRRDFNRVLSNGKRFPGRIITILVCPVDPREGFKAGFTVRKKIFKRAVDRNRVKRRLREIVRLCRPALNDNIWIILLAGPETLKAPWQSLCEEFNELCLRAGILRNTDGPQNAPAG